MPLETHSDPPERRTEPRRPVTGQVKLRPEGFAGTNVAFHMLDINSGGFRARHSFPALVSGHIVEYAYGNLEGRARVVWTRILSDHVESGFLILSRPRD